MKLDLTAGAGELKLLCSFSWCKTYFGKFWYLMCITIENASGTLRRQRIIKLKVLMWSPISEYQPDIIYVILASLVER